MATYITVIDGPLEGERFEIKGGEKLGREKGDIVLNDPKSSSHHAQIKKSLLGQLTLVDLKSKNGIFSEGNRVDRVKLADGVEFRIGANTFRVELEVESKAGSKSNIPIPDLPTEGDIFEDETVDASPPESKNDETTLQKVEDDEDLEGFEFSESGFLVDPKKIDSEITEEDLEDNDDLDDEQATRFNINPEEIMDGETFVYDPGTKKDESISIFSSEKQSDENSEVGNEEPTVARPLKILDESEELLKKDLGNDDLSSLSLNELTTKGATTQSPSRLSFRTLDSNLEEEKPGLFEEVEKKTWSSVLEKFSRNNLKYANDELKEIEPLNPRVKLTFIRGTQAEIEWELGYGPRKAGPLSTDLPIWEPAAPKGDCFDISPSDQGPKFSTKFPNIVKINGMSVEEVTLRSGDIISIDETEIEVELF